MFEGTNEHTFELARELVLAGADPAHCARNIYFGHSTAKMRLLGAALSNLHREGSLAWISVSQEQMQRCHAREEDCEGLVNYALSMQGVEVALFFRELPDGRFRISLRSKGKVNVAAVAERLGRWRAPVRQRLRPRWTAVRRDEREFSLNFGSALPYNKSHSGFNVTDFRIQISGFRLLTATPANPTSHAAPGAGLSGRSWTGFCWPVFAASCFSSGSHILACSEPTSRVMRRWRARCLPVMTGSRLRSAASPGWKSRRFYYWQTMLAYSVFRRQRLGCASASAVRRHTDGCRRLSFPAPLSPGLSTGWRADGGFRQRCHRLRSGGLDRHASGCHFHHRHAGLVCVVRKREPALPGPVLRLSWTGHVWPKDQSRHFWRLVIIAIFSAAKGDYRLLARTCWIPGILSSL